MSFWAIRDLCVTLATGYEALFCGSQGHLGAPACLRLHSWTPEPTPFLRGCAVLNGLGQLSCFDPDAVREASLLDNTGGEAPPSDQDIGWLGGGGRGGVNRDGTATPIMEFQAED